MDKYAGVGTRVDAVAVRGLGEAEEVQAVIEVQGVNYDYQRRSRRVYVSLFGKGSIWVLGR